jgi:hypothetical protein
MVRRRVRTLSAAAVALLVAGAVVAVVVLTTAPGAPTPPLPESGVLVRSTVTPPSAFFGDTVTARVEVLFDPRRVRTPRLSVSRRFSSYQVHGRPTVERKAVGRAESVTYLLRLVCLDASCLPGDPTKNPHQSFALPSVRVNYVRTGGGNASAAVPLPLIDVGSRVTPEEGSTLMYPPHPPLAASLRPLPVHYSISPTLLAALLLAGSVLLFAICGFLLWRFAPRWHRRRRPLTPLERAVALVEASLARGVVPDQRKALELLAQELGRSGEERIAFSARVLAWSAPAPGSEATTELAGEVRQLIVGRTNGRAA